MFIRNLGLAVVCLFIFSSVHGSEPNEHFHDALWVAESHGVLKIAVAGGDIDLTIDSAEEVRAVAIDPVGALVWVARAEHLTAYAFDGVVQHSIQLESANTPSGTPVLSVDRRDGSVWLARGRMLEIFAFDGSLIASSQLSDDVVAMALGESEGTRWITSRRQVELRNEDGNVLDQWTATRGEKIRDIALHVTEDALWLVSNRHVYLYSPSQQDIAWQRDEGHLERIRLHNDGSAWLAGKRRLLRLNLQGSGTGGFEYAQPGSLVDFVVDHLDGSIWIATQQHLGRYRPDGTLVDDHTFTGAGHKGRLWSLALYVDDIPPSIAIVDPVPGALTNNSLFPFELQYEDIGIGVDPETLEFFINDTSAPFDCEELDETGSRCTPVHALPEGGNQVEATVSDFNLNVSEPASVEFDVDTIPPEFLELSPEDGSEVSTSPVAVSGRLSEPADLAINGHAVDHDADLRFDQELELAAGPNTIELDAVDPAGNAAHEELSIKLEQATGDLPPDPEDVAPDLPAVGSPSFHEQIEFLYVGMDPVQTGVQPGTMERRRAAVIRGGVIDRSGAAVAGVRISVRSHPEYGQTYTRENGMFDIVLNGGGLIVLEYHKDGYLPVQRRITPKWNRWAHLDDVVMVQLDDNVTTIDLGPDAPAQIGAGSVVEDEDGIRRAVVLFPEGVGADLEMSDGMRMPLESLSFRATEYTVGGSGPQAMPGELPARTGYTYAVELSSDEAIEAGAQSVVFDEPVSFYVDNFLSFPIGSTVPAGWYDRERAVWVPSENGRVVEVLSIDGEMAQLDVEGDGEITSTAALEELGIDSKELSQIAALYEPGDSLWRTSINHFTPWDCNWPFGPPMDAEQHEESMDQVEEPEDERPDCEEMSVLECENQILRKSIPILGTPHSIVYSSDRVPGRKVERILDIPVSGESIPESLESILLKVKVAGRTFDYQFEPEANITHHFEWDGRDAFGRSMIGVHHAEVNIGYVYEAVYYAADEDFLRSFNRLGDESQPLRLGRDKIVLWRDYEFSLISHGEQPRSLGAWRLDIDHQFYSPSRLYMGDGSRRSSSLLIPTPKSFAGGGHSGYEGDGGDALDALFSPAMTSLNRYRYYMPFDTGPDGSLYILDYRNHVIRHIDPDGIITTIAGTGVQGYSGDGGPAVEANLSFGDIGLGHIRLAGIEVTSDGSVFFTQANDHVVRRIDPEGIIETIAGNGQKGFPEDGGNAVDQPLYTPVDVAVSSDGTIYILEGHDDALYAIDPDQQIDVLYGSPSEHLPSRALWSMKLIDDEIYIERRHGTYGGWDAKIWHLAQDGTFRPISDKIIRPPSHRRRSVGDLESVDFNDIVDSWYYVRSPNGTAFRHFRYQIVNFSARFDDPAVLNYRVASGDAMLLYVFDPLGRVLASKNVLDGENEYRFNRNSDGDLLRVHDRHGSQTQFNINHTQSGVLIESEDGHVTELKLNSDGYVDTVVAPGGRVWELGYSDGGLLTSARDPRGHDSSYEYDERGRLIKATDALGGGWEFDVARDANSKSVTARSEEGRVRNYILTVNENGGKSKDRIGADGLITQFEEEVVQSRRVSKSVLPDGSVISQRDAPDERFGFQSPIPERIEISFPSGLQHSVTKYRDIRLQDENDLLSVEQLIEVTSVNGRSYTVLDEPLLNSRTISSPEGRETTVSLNEERLPLEIQHGQMYKELYEYDDKGRATSWSEVGSGTRRDWGIEYHHQGHQAGMVASITNPLGLKETFEYDDAGRVVRRVLNDHRAIEFDYDASGNLKMLTTPGQETYMFEYDAIGNRSAYIAPELPDIGVVTLYRYNLDRQLVEIERPGGEGISFDYDYAGRLQAVASTNGKVDFSYHPVTGQLTAISAPGDIEQTFFWDGMLPTREVWSGLVSGSITRSYNENLWQVGETVEGHVVRYQFDNDGFVIGAGELALTRDAQGGLLTGTRYGNIGGTREYNSFAELTERVVTFEGSSLYEVAYERDSVGRVNKQVQMVNKNVVSWGYSYDDFGRLVEVTRDGNVEYSYSYDENGNRVAYTDSEGTRLGEYDDQDRLIRYGEIFYSYTEAGARLSRTDNDGTTNYEYDAVGNLRNVILPNDKRIEYLIDGRNRRVGKIVNGEVEKTWIYRDQLNPVAQFDGEGNLTHRFVYAEQAHSPSYLVKIDPMTGAETVYRLVTDHLGSIRLVVDVQTGVIAQRLEYGPFGAVLYDSQPGFQPLGYAGGLYDEQTRLVRFGARDYDPEVGRWTAKDPIDFEGGDTNLYQYVGGSATTGIDPSGLQFRIYPPAPRVGQSYARYMQRFNQWENARRAGWRNEIGEPSFPRIPGEHPLRSGGRLLEQIGNYLRDLKAYGDFFSSGGLFPCPTSTDEERERRKEFMRCVEAGWCV